jgi:hypothetical protein
MGSNVEIRRTAFTPRRRHLGLVALLLPLASTFSVLGATTFAHASTPTPVSAVFIDSEAGDFLGQGVSGTSASNPGSVTYEGNVDGIQTFTYGGTAAWTFSFAAPPGETLESGTYEDAVRAVSRAAGQPGLDVGSPGRGCNTVAGRFIVDEVTYDSSGELTSFAARFEDHCEGETGAVFGDLLYNSTAPMWARNVTPNALNFTTDPTQTVTITNYGPSSDTPEGFTVTGPSAGEFSVTASTCTGTLAPGAACQVAVTYTPSASDPTPSASLWFNDSLAPLGSDGEPGGAGQGRFVTLSAALGQYPIVAAVLSPEGVDAGWRLGTTVTDTVSVEGSALGGSPSGNVAFYACLMTPGSSCNPSSAKWQDDEQLVPGPGDSSITTSAPFAPSAVGDWCYLIEYSGDGYYESSGVNVPSGLGTGGCLSIESPSEPTVSTTTQLEVPSSPLLSGSEAPPAFTAIVTGQSGDGMPEGVASIYNGSQLLCTVSLLGYSPDSAYAWCYLSPSEIGPGTYNDLFAVYSPGTPSTNDAYATWNYWGSTSAPQSLTIATITTSPPPSGSPSPSPTSTSSPTSPASPSSPPSSSGNPPAPAGTGSSGLSSGYDLVGRDGGVFVFPTSQSGGYDGSLPGDDVHVDNVVGMVPSPDDRGYFLVGSDGGVFAFGGATFEGSLPGLHVTVDNIRGIVPTTDDRGYFLVGSDGGVFAFGDAPYLGSLPGRGIHTDDVLGIAATPDDRGYWLVAANGAVYAFGDATAYGSALGTPSPVSAIACTPDGGGYWIVTQAGGVYPFGDARSFGSLPAMGARPSRPVIGLVPTVDGNGYWLIGSDGGIFTFGDAPFVGSLPGLGVHVSDVVGAVPTRP